MGMFNSFALKQMAKENLVTMYRKYGQGHPSSGAKSAIAEAAAALDTGSERQLRTALDRFAASVNQQYPPIKLGIYALSGLTFQFPQYQWADMVFVDWEEHHLGNR